MSFFKALVNIFSNSKMIEKEVKFEEINPELNENNIYKTMKGRILNDNEQYNEKDYKFYNYIYKLDNDALVENALSITSNYSNKIKDFEVAWYSILATVMNFIVDELNEGNYETDKAAVKRMVDAYFSYGDIRGALYPSILEYFEDVGLSDKLWKSLSEFVEENKDSLYISFKNKSKPYGTNSKEIFIENLAKLKNVASTDTDKRIIDVMSINDQDGTDLFCATIIVEAIELLHTIGFNSSTIIDSIYNLNEDSYGAVTTYLFLLFGECTKLFKSHPNYIEIIGMYTNNLGNYLSRECGKLDFINTLHHMQRTIGVSDMFFDELIEYFSKNRNNTLSFLDNEINK